MGTMLVLQYFLCKLLQKCEIFMHTLGPLMDQRVVIQQLVTVEPMNLKRHI